MTNEEIEYTKYLTRSNTGKFICGIDTAIKALRPGAKYDMSASGGHFTFTRWEDPNGKDAPTTEAVKKEFEYQKKFIAYHDYFLERAANYPDILKLIELLWEAIDTDVFPGKETDFYKTVKQINDKFPKSKGNPPVRPTE